MITKPLKDLDTLKNKYEQDIKNAQTEEEIKSIKTEFLNELKLYLFEANNLIKQIFSQQISPFETSSGGYNGLMKKNSADSITKKTKTEFYEEVDSLLRNALFFTLDDEKKTDVERAVYVLKTYYEDNLN